MSGKSTEHASFLPVGQPAGRSSGQSRSDYCVIQILFHMCGLERLCNRSKRQPDSVYRVGKSTSACWRVLLARVGLIWLSFDGLVLDTAILHYPS